MATVEPSACPPLKAQPITAVQPGGGTCMSLELAWGRLRRHVLRRGFPNYVAKMAAQRQGECPNCPHDVIDSRDLKYYRNVCGYWFREEDDEFRGRDDLGIARLGLAEIVCFSFGWFCLTMLVLFLAMEVHWAVNILLLPIAVFWAFTIAFFRDPERRIPDDPDALVSPADGTITHIEETADPDFPGGRAFRISIFLSVFNVHVNRLPRAGKVAALAYYPGDFLDARHPQCGTANEQLWIDLDDAATGKRLRIKQIAGKIARRIVCTLKVGEEVERGARLGLIKFGSRTEVYLPTDLPVDVNVKIGDNVSGGSTVLLRFKR